jgi:flagellar hook-basal body complex protein FliE
MSPITSINGIGLGPAVVKPNESKGSGFQDLLQNAIGQVDGMRKTADTAVERFLSGEGEELHSTVMATQRAELAFEMFVQVRNKVVQAYQEVMRMQM